ncbi:MAG: hypothetical protein AB7K24_02475 [Gemmataceae bacterium]
MMATKFPTRWRTALVVLAAFVFPLQLRAEQPRAAAPEEPVEGLFVTVQNPITSNVVKRIEAQVQRFLERTEGRKGVKIVFDFNPEGASVQSDDFGACRGLAQYILNLQDVTTIAFVHNEVTGHTVLPVFACREVVMSKGGKPIRDNQLSATARIGEAMRGQTNGLEEDQRLFYKQVAQRRGRPPALLLKMADPHIEVLSGVRNGARWYVDSAELAEAKKSGFSPDPTNPKILAGKQALYATPEALEYGLCVNLTRETRQEVAEAYRMPPRSLREDPLEGRQPIASLVEVKGPINAALAERLKRQMRRSIGNQNVNFFILKLDCHGGDPQVARELAEFFRNLRDDRGDFAVMTVAYVTREADDNATFLALGCTEIAMESEGHLGGFQRIVEDRPNLQESIGEELAGVAGEQGYPPILARGMLDPNMAIYYVQSQKGPFERRLISENELRTDRAGDQRWTNPQLIKPSGEWFKLTAERAKDLGVARHVVPGPAEAGLTSLYASYGLEEDSVKLARNDWLDEVAAFLRLGWVGALLVMIGITGLILEMKMPGFGLPGVTAAICFVLFFWAHSQLAGQWVMLAILLFVLGLILIGIEVFLIPGFGITGVSGIFLVIVSLALATLVKKPETTAEWMNFGASVSQFVIATGAAVVLAFVVGRNLHHIPWVNRMVLLPPSDQLETSDDDFDQGQSDRYAALLGTIGEAATTLRPAGKARFGDEFIDVDAEGSYVQPGTRIQDNEIEGNRIDDKEIH